MTRRFRPALVLCSVCTIAVMAVVALVRARHRPPESPPASLAATSIDASLTRDDRGCAGVRSTVWHPLSGVEYTGRLRVDLPPQPGGSIVFFAGDSVPLDFEADTIDGRPMSMQVERLPQGPGLQVPPDFWLDDSAPWKAPPEIARVTIDAAVQRVSRFTLALGRRAPRVLARLAGYPPETRVAVCADHVGPGEIYFATGWYGGERSADGPIRWMREFGAVLMSSSTGDATRVRLRAAPAVEPGVGDETFVSLRVNDVFDAPPRPMRGGFADYEWDVPDSAWVAGTNELFFRVSRTVSSGTRTLGLALASVTAR